jgi:hypothetical protein
MWDQIRTRVYEKAASLRSSLSRATVDALEGGTVTITIVDALLEDQVRKNVGLIEDALLDLLGSPLRVAIRTTSGAAASSRGARSSSAHRSAPVASEVAPPASAGAGHGENDLLAYARIRLAGAPSETETE